jgi:hypothetical protein
MEDTATLEVTIKVKLTAEEGIDAETKAEATRQLVRDQIEAIKRTYDTGVEIMPGSKIVYVGRDEEPLS